MIDSAKHLKQLRLDAGLTQLELGMRIGLSRETISAIENEHKAAINALTFEVVRKWWKVCRQHTDSDTNASLRRTILDFFKL